MNAASGKVPLRLANVAAGREQRSDLLRKAAFLPAKDAAMLELHLSGEVSRRELAALQGITPRQVRRRLDRLEQVLSDPCYLLAARYADTLPEQLRPLARAYWVEGLSLRELAARCQTTLHYVRQQIVIIRSQLMFSAERRERKAM